MFNNMTKVLVLKCIYGTFKDIGSLFTELSSTSPPFVRAVSLETEILSYLGCKAPPQLREGSVYHVGLLFAKGHITVSVSAGAVKNYGVVWLLPNG